MSQGTPEDVESISRNIDALERLIGSISPSDDFGEAIVRNQTLMLQALRASQSGEIDRENLAVGLVGTATERINVAARGPAIFTVGGSEFRVEVLADAEVQEDQEVVVVGEGNVVVPADDMDITTSGSRLRGTSNTTTTTRSPGESNAAVVRLGSMRQNFDIGYTVSASVPLTIEHSPDSETWYSLYETTASGSDTIQGSSMFEYVRVYAAESADAGSIGALTLAAKGV